MLITIITAVYNNKACIGTSLESVAAQTYPHIEHIVIDGGSADGTLDIIESRRRRIARLVSEPDKGIYDALNKGIRLATGDVIGFLHSDDVYENNSVIEKVASLISANPVDSCYGDLLYVNKNNLSKIVRYWRSGQYREGLFLGGWMPPHPTFFVRRGVYEKYGVFNPALGSAADYELMLRFLVKHKISTAYIPEVLVRMRTGGASNRSVMDRLHANRMDRLAWDFNGLKPSPFTLFMKPLRKLGQFISGYPGPEADMPHVPQTAEYPDGAMGAFSAAEPAAEYQADISTGKKGRKVDNGKEKS